MLPRSNIAPASYCKRCRFYHGAHRVVCGPHPYGPESKICSDYAPEDRELSQSRTSGEHRSICQFLNWKRWQKSLILGLLMWTFVYGCFLRWAAINPMQPPIKAIPKSGYLR